jgi:hypothetical protein
MRRDEALLTALARPRAKAKASEFFPNNPTASQFTGQRPANDPLLNALVKAGRQFWATRNVQLPEQIAVDVADDLREGNEHGVVQGRAWNPAVQGDARIALDSELVGGSLRLARSRRPTVQRRTALKELAGVVLHEMGHVGGVDHAGEDRQGFRGAGGGGDLVPQEVARLIRRLVPRRRGERPSRGGYGGG